MPTRRENSSQVSPGWAFVRERLAADNQAFWDLACDKKQTPSMVGGTRSVPVTVYIYTWYTMRTCSSSPGTIIGIVSFATRFKYLLVPIS